MLTIINTLFFAVGLIALVAFVLLMIAGFKRSLWWGLALLFLPFTTLIYAIKYWQEVKKPFLVYVGSNTLSIAIVGFVFTQLGGMQAVQMAQDLNAGSLTDAQAAQFMLANMEGTERLGVGGKDEMLAEVRADPHLTDDDVKQVEQMLGQIDALAQGDKASFQDGGQEQGSAIPLQPAMAAEIPEAVDDIEDKIASMEAQMAELDTTENTSADNTTIDQDTSAQVSALGVPLPEYVESPVAEPPQAVERKQSGPVSLAEADRYLGDIFIVTTQEGVTRRATLKDVHGTNLEFQRRAFGGSITYTIAKAEIKSLVLD